MKPWQQAKQMRQVLTHQLIEMKQTDKGRGIFSLVDHKIGDPVCAFTGRLATFADYESAEAFNQSRDAEYAMQYDMGRILIPKVDEIGGHIANHSCNPNTEAERGKQGTIVMTAIRPIKAGDEITIDYHWHKKTSPVCLCGSDPCAGHIGVAYSTGEALDHDGNTITTFSLDEEQVIKMLQVAEAHRHKGALHSLKINGRFIKTERIHYYLERAFGLDWKDSWLFKTWMRPSKLAA